MKINNPPYDFFKYNLPECVERTDLRHIFMIYHVLKSLENGKVAEFGVFNGDCSTAFIEIVNSGIPQEAWFCDTQFNKNFDKVVGHCKFSEKLYFHQGFSTELLSKRAFDLVFVDTDHRLENSEKELKLLMEMKCPNIFAHDTSSSNCGLRLSEGSAYIKHFLQAELGYYCLEDNLKRQGERTERGLFFATTSLENYRVAKEGFRIYGEI